MGQYLDYTTVPGGNIYLLGHLNIIKFSASNPGANFLIPVTASSFQPDGDNNENNNYFSVDSKNNIYVNKLDFYGDFQETVVKSTDNGVTWVPVYGAIGAGTYNSSTLGFKNYLTQSFVLQSDYFDFNSNRGCISLLKSDTGNAGTYNLIDNTFNRLQGGLEFSNMMGFSVGPNYIGYGFNYNSASFNGYAVVLFSNSLRSR
jgi:chitinase